MILPNQQASPANGTMDDLPIGSQDDDKLARNVMVAVKPPVVEFATDSGLFATFWLATLLNATLKLILSRRYPPMFSLLRKHPRAISGSIRLALTLSLGVLPLGVAWAQTPQTTGWNLQQQGAFVVALGRDARGDIWAGTEDNGVARFAGGKWNSFGVADGLGDNSVYAITTDLLGRVWVGHLNHGVSVWNGQTWKNYGVGQGPLGERVFALATSPVSGDVWIAHNAGLTRYSEATKSWTHFNRANGFPTDEISALAFDSTGRLWVGTQHDGLLVGSPTDKFASWRRIPGPKTMPLAPEGDGLPSSRINALAVANDDTIYVATDTGLAQSRDGENWRFVRGADWRKKVEGAGLTPVATEAAGDLLPEDYVTALAADARGILWVGTRGGDTEAFRPATEGASLFLGAPLTNSYAAALLSLEDGSALLGQYNGGVTISGRVAAFAPTPEERKLVRAPLPVPPDNAILPVASSAPDADELNRLLATIRARVQTPDATRVVQLPDDWTTQGTWRGRYGRYFATLSAMISPSDYVWNAGGDIPYDVKLGPGGRANDGARYYIQDLAKSDPRALEMPSIYLDSRLALGYLEKSADPATQKTRRPSEWNDNGGAYPMTEPGPGLDLTVDIPAGDHVLSLFDFNKDGHTGPNWARDYLVSVRPHPADAALNDVSSFDNQPEWASSRWRDFWGSNWKRFAVRGPQQLTVRVDRNFSYNTMLMGAFVDEISEEPAPYFDAAMPPSAPGDWHAKNGAERPTDALAEALWGELDKAKAADVLWWSANNRLFYEALLRYYQPALERTDAAQTDALWRRIGTCDYVLCQYPQWEAAQEKRGLVSARTVDLALRFDPKIDSYGRGRDAIIASRKGEPLAPLPAPQTEAEFAAATAKAAKNRDWDAVRALQEQLLALKDLSPQSDAEARFMIGNSYAAQAKAAQSRAKLEELIQKDYPNLSPAQATEVSGIKQSAQMMIGIGYFGEGNPDKGREVLQDLITKAGPGSEFAASVKQLLEAMTPKPKADKTN